MQQWQLPKRKKLRRTGVAVVDVDFDRDSDRFYAAASNGFIHALAADIKTAGSTDEPAVSEEP